MHSAFLKNKKNLKKDVSHLKIASHSKSQKRNIEKRERKTKNENSQATTITLFSFTFLCRKIYICYI